jgi:hypothetical protein
MSTLRNVLVLTTAAVLAAGCTVTFTPESAPGRTAGPGGIRVVGEREAAINRYLDLRAFPGSRNVETSFDGRDSETRFEASARLEAVYRHFHEQLVAMGWRRVTLEIESDEIEAEYVRGELELELELELEGPGRFELEIDVD